MKPVLSSPMTLILLIILRVSTSYAVVPETKVYSDQLGMPRCLVQAGSRSPGLLILANGDDYVRKIKVFEIDNQSDCANWESTVQTLEPGAGTEILPGATAYREFFLTAKVRLAIEELRNGAIEFHSETTGEDYLAAHPISEFTFKSGHDLLRRVGAGFTSLIYRAWLLQDPTNRKFHDDVVSKMRSFSELDQKLLSTQLPNRVVLYVKGLAHELKTAKRFNILSDQLKAMNIPVYVAKTASFAPLRENAKLIQDQLQQLLAQGKDVIILSLSKGAPEALYAVASMKTQLEDQSQSAGYGKLEAFVSLSGMFAPSFFVNWTSAPIQWAIAKGVMKNQFKADGLEVPDMKGLKDLNKKNMTKIMSEIGEMGLPQNVVYVNLSGALSGNALSSDKDMRDLQDKLLRKAPFLSFGANDGYIEYPGNLIPKT